MYFKTGLGNLYNEDCIKFLDNTDMQFDMVITSPPYNIGKRYDVYEDRKPIREYYCWLNQVFASIYNHLKPDGRFALNILYEANFKLVDGDRVFFSSDIWQMLKKIGFKWAGLIELNESVVYKSRLTAWGSYLSPSAPYIYNPKECVLLVYKNEWKKAEKKETDITKEDKEEFIKITSGQWDYKADTKQLTEASFSLDIPLHVIKYLTWTDDLIYDPFSGSGTTALACEMLKRKWVANEISPNYCQKSKDRLQEYLLPERMKTFF